MKVGERVSLCRAVRAHRAVSRLAWLSRGPLGWGGEVNSTACEQRGETGVDGSMRSHEAQVRNYAGFPKTHWGTLSRVPEREGGILPRTCHPRPAEHRFCSLCRQHGPHFLPSPWTLPWCASGPRGQRDPLQLPPPVVVKDAWLKPAHGAAETLRPPGLWKHSHSFPLCSGDACSEGPCCKVSVSSSRAATPNCSAAGLLRHAGDLPS